jgi:hypothetical protein
MFFQVLNDFTAPKSPSPPDFESRQCPERSQEPDSAITHTEHRAHLRCAQQWIPNPARRL